MAAIKSYTDLEQSKFLAKILSYESSDGFWEYHDKWCSEGDEWEGYEDYPRAEPYLEYTRKENEWKEDKSDIPCWSLTALLGVLPKGTNIGTPCPIEEHCCCWNQYDEIYADNPIDACYEMILELHKLNLL